MLENDATEIPTRISTGFPSERKKKRKMKMIEINFTYYNRLCRVRKVDLNFVMFNRGPVACTFFTF